MPAYLAIATFVTLIICVLLRVRQMKKLGIAAMKFGVIDKSDFILPPLMLLYFYILLAYAFGWPKVDSLWLENSLLAWLGVALCLFGLFMFIWGMVSFGQSFRVGIDQKQAGKLVQEKAFAFSRNPLYLGFLSIFFGVWAILPTWFFLLYLIGAFIVINRQINREQEALKKIYGDEYLQYMKKVRRFF